jgi:hypothetical protein
MSALVAPQWATISVHKREERNTFTAALHEPANPSPGSSQAPHWHSTMADCGACWGGPCAVSQLPSMWQLVEAAGDGLRLYISYTSGLVQSDAMVACCMCPCPWLACPCSPKRQFVAWVHFGVAIYVQATCECKFGAISDTILVALICMEVKM